jgi:hypothetical protein
MLEFWLLQGRWIENSATVPYESIKTRKGWVGNEGDFGDADGAIRDYSWAKGQNDKLVAISRDSFSRI